MTDPVATPQDPAASADLQEPTADPIEEPAAVEPEYLTAAQAKELLDKQAASFQSWLGRRDKETFAHIGTIIEERIKDVKPQVSNDELSTRLLESPREFVRQEFEALQNERTQKQTKHLNSTMETVAELMDTDPLYSDKDLGNSVVEEIKKMVQSGKMSNELKPKDAGKVLLADALTSVFRKRQSLKTNPLSANTPGSGASNLSPPSAAVKKVKVPKLDEVTQRMADKWGYKPEDLAAIYGE